MSSIFKKWEELKKGISPETIQEWIDYNPKHSVRSKIAEEGMGSHRKNALDELAKHTHVRMNGNTREYLLHRTLGNMEAENIKNGHYNNVGKVRKIGKGTFQPYTSWSPKVLNPEDGLLRQHVVSAWIPEEAISVYIPHVVKQVEFNHNTKANVDPLELVDFDKEVIVNPGKFPVLHYSKVPINYSNRLKSDNELAHTIKNHKYILDKKLASLNKEKLANQSKLQIVTDFASQKRGVR